MRTASDSDIISLARRKSSLRGPIHRPSLPVVYTEQFALVVVVIVVSESTKFMKKRRIAGAGSRRDLTMTSRLIKSMWLAFASVEKNEKEEEEEER